MTYDDAFKMIDDVTDIPEKEYKETELKAISDLAQGIGLYEWKYEPGVTGEQELHLGPIAQDLLRVPGLASAVHKDANGVVTIDSKFVALATLSYVATLARILSGIEYIGPNVKEGE